MKRIDKDLISDQDILFIHKVNNVPLQGVGLNFCFSRIDDDFDRNSLTRSKHKPIHLFSLIFQRLSIFYFL